MMISTSAQTKIKKLSKSIVKTALIGIFWLGLWQLIYKAVNLDVLIASPIDVLKKLWELLPTSSFWRTIFQSFVGIAIGYIIGVVIGFILGIITSFSSLLSSLLKPLLTAIKTTPVVSFIILALVWIPKMQIPIFISSLMVIPIVWANTSIGIKETDKELLEMANAYNFSFSKKLKLIYIPSAMPSFVGACETALGLAWKAGIAAEVLSIPQNSIGVILHDSQVYLETIDLFAWTAVVIIISLILEKVLASLFNIIFKYVMKKGGYFIENKNK